MNMNQDEKDLIVLNAAKRDIKKIEAIPVALTLDEQMKLAMCKQTVQEFPNRNRKEN